MKEVPPILKTRDGDRSASIGEVVVFDHWAQAADEKYMDENKGVRLLCWVSLPRWTIEDISREITMRLPYRVATKYVTVCVSQIENWLVEMGHDIQISQTPNCDFGAFTLFGQPLTLPEP
jgi:hypothetical protein